jgi:hypothetical protein
MARIVTLPRNFGQRKIQANRYEKNHYLHTKIADRRDVTVSVLSYTALKYMKFVCTDMYLLLLCVLLCASHLHLPLDWDKVRRRDTAVFRM